MTPWGPNKEDYAEIVGKAVAAAMAAASNAQPTAVQRGWKCNRADCLYAVKGWDNWSGRTHCQGCFKPRQAAMNPPEGARLAPRPPKEPRPSASAAGVTDK